MCIATVYNIGARTVVYDFTYFPDINDYDNDKFAAVIDKSSSAIFSIFMQSLCGNISLPKVYYFRDCCSL